MSHKINQNQRFWKDVEAELRCTPMIFRGTRLCEEDAALWSRTLTLLGLQLQDILSDSRSLVDLPCRCKKYVCTLADLDIASVSSAFKALSGFIRRYINMDEEPVGSYREFKRRVDAADYLIECCTFPVQHEIEVLLSSYDIGAFRKLSQLFAFTSHVTFRSIIFDDVIDDFRRIDADLAVSASDSTIHALMLIMREWLTGFRISEDNFKPHHGPGGIAESGRTSLYEKYRHLVLDPVLKECFRWHQIDATKYFIDSGFLDRTARLVAVPKSTLTSRTICMEPATLQFAQQGVLAAIAEWFRYQPVLRRCIHLKDQEVNRCAARSGSQFGELATIDLSSASDTVSWDLVRRIFAGTDYLQWCLATRSRAVKLPSDEVIQLNKFAPMGSALCFPTECLVFACACELTARRHRTPSMYKVYGDDIVIEEDLTEDLILLLTSLGFKVNIQKSFTGASVVNFRESCGGEYVCGVDTTPLRLSRWLTGDKPDLATILCRPQVISRYVSLINEMHTCDLSAARAYLLKEICELPSKFLPIFGDGTRGTIFSPMPDNFRHKSRFNSRLYRHELLTWRLVARPDPRDEHLLDEADYEEIRLNHWFVCRDARLIDSTPQECFEFDPLSEIPTLSLDLEHTLCRSLVKLSKGYTAV